MYFIYIYIYIYYEELAHAIMKGKSQNSPCANRRTRRADAIVQFTSKDLSTRRANGVKSQSKAEKTDV